jgi:hypothetical protein
MNKKQLHGVKRRQLSALGACTTHNPRAQN